MNPVIKWLLWLSAAAFFTATFLLQSADAGIAAVFVLWFLVIAGGMLLSPLEGPVRSLVARLRGH